MIIPMVIMQAGIFYDYWGDFSENALFPATSPARDVASTKFS